MNANHPSVVNINTPARPSLGSTAHQQPSIPMNVLQQLPTVTVPNASQHPNVAPQSNASRQSPTTQNCSQHTHAPAASNNPSQTVQPRHSSRFTSLKDFCSTNRVNLALSVPVLAFAIAGFWAQLRANHTGEEANRIARNSFNLALWDECKGDDVANTERCRAIKANGFDAIVSRQVHTRQFVSTNPDHHDKEDSPLELEKYLRMCSSIASKPDRHRVYLHGCSSIATKSDKYLRMCSSIAENPDRYLGYLEGCSSIASEPIQKRNAASIRRDFKEKFIVGRLMRYRTSISTDMHKIWGVIRRATKSPGYNVFIGMLLCHFLFLCMLRDLVVRSWAKMKLPLFPAPRRSPTPRSSSSGYNLPERAGAFDSTRLHFAGQGTNQVTMLSGLIMLSLLPALSVSAGFGLHSHKSGDLACGTALAALLLAFLLAEPITRHARRTLRKPPDEELRRAQQEGELGMTLPEGGLHAISIGVGHLSARLRRRRT